jgi:hypothetical protein
VDVTAVEPHDAVVELDRRRVGQRGERLGVVEGHPGLERGKGDGPVHGASIQRVEPQGTRDPAGDGGLPRPGGAVDRDHEDAHQPMSSISHDLISRCAR